jgi:hypothetical protein
MSEVRGERRAVLPIRRLGSGESLVHGDEEEFRALVGGEPGAGLDRAIGER